MEDFKQQEAEAIFRQIDNQILSYYRRENWYYPDIKLIHEAIACVYNHPTHKNLMYINKLRSLLYSWEKSSGLFMEERSEEESVSMFLLLGFPDKCEGERELEEYQKMSLRIFNVAYSHLFKGITLEEYVKPLLDLKENYEVEVLKPHPHGEVVGFENVFNYIEDINIIKSSFEGLTKKRGSDGKPILTHEQLELFIEAAFVKGYIHEKISMNMQNVTKATVISIFKSFHNICSRKYENSPKYTKAKYLRLLTDYFEGWDFDTLSKNFRSQVH